MTKKFICECTLFLDGVPSAVKYLHEIDAPPTVGFAFQHVLPDGTINREGSGWVKHILHAGRNTDKGIWYSEVFLSSVEPTEFQPSSINYRFLYNFKSEDPKINDEQVYRAVNDTQPMPGDEFGGERINVMVWRPDIKCDDSTVAVEVLLLGNTPNLPQYNLNMATPTAEQ